jgi:hypothetical protein
MSAEAECVTKALALRTQSGSREQAQGDSLPVAFVSTAFAERAAGRLGMVCFLFPLIEPDRRISRIRLSEKVSQFRPRKAAGPSSKFDKAQHLMQGSNGKLLSCLPSQFVPGRTATVATSCEHVVRQRSDRENSVPGARLNATVGWPTVPELESKPTGMNMVRAVTMVMIVSEPCCRLRATAI